MKKCLSLLLAAVMLLSMCAGTATATEEKTYPMGDINMDGVLRAVDLTMLYHYFDRGYTLSEEALALADISGDNRVSISDAVHIHYRLCNMISSTADFGAESQTTPDEEVYGTFAVQTDPHIGVIAAGEQITVGISASAMNDIAGMGLRLSFDATKLKCVSGEKAGWLGEMLFADIATLPVDYEGEVWMSGVTVDTVDSEEGEVFATLTFTAQQEINEPLSFTIYDADIVTADADNVITDRLAAWESGSVDMTYETDDMRFEPDGNGNVTLIGYSGSDAAVIIPSKVGAETVTAIASGAFADADMISVVVPKSVKAIAADAFDRCDDLKTVYYIGDAASWNAIAENGLAAAAVRYCQELLVDTLTGEITYLTHDDGTATLFRYDNPTTMPFVFKNWGSYTVTAIADGAFENCTTAEYIILPDCITDIGERVFDGCISLKGIAFQGSREQWDALDPDGNYDHIVVYDEHHSILSADGFKFFLRSDNTATVMQFSEFGGTIPINAEIPAQTIDGFTVTAIADRAFENCSELESMLIPETVEYIGTDAFTGCTCYLYCFEDSYAERYAIENEIPYIMLVYVDGDVNGDDSVTIADAVQLYYHVNGRIVLDEVSLLHGDVALPENEITIADAVTLYYYVNGKLQIS